MPAQCSTWVRTRIHKFWLLGFPSTNLRSTYTINMTSTVCSAHFRAGCLQSSPWWWDVQRPTPTFPSIQPTSSSAHWSWSHHNTSLNLLGLNRLGSTEHFEIYWVGFLSLAGWTKVICDRFCRWQNLDPRKNNTHTHTSTKPMLNRGTANPLRNNHSTVHQRSIIQNLRLSETI